MTILSQHSLYCAVHSAHSTVWWNIVYAHFLWGANMYYMLIWKYVNARNQGYFALLCCSALYYYTLWKLAKKEEKKRKERNGYGNRDHPQRMIFFFGVKTRRKPKEAVCLAFDITEHYFNGYEHLSFDSTYIMIWALGESHALLFIVVYSMNLGREEINEKYERWSQIDNVRKENIN